MLKRRRAEIEKEEIPGSSQTSTLNFVQTPWSRQQLSVGRQLSHRTPFQLVCNVNFAHYTQAHGNMACTVSCYGCTTFTVFYVWTVIIGHRGRYLCRGYPSSSFLHKCNTYSYFEWSITNTIFGVHKIEQLIIFTQECYVISLWFESKKHQVTNKKHLVYGY